MKGSIKNYKWLLAIVLAVTFALGSVIASAHSHVEHPSSLCSICLLQPTALTASTDNSNVTVVPKTVTNLLSHIEAPRSLVFSNQSARAPPTYL